MPKVSKVNRKGYFRYKDVMETIEDLVLIERTFLGESNLYIFDYVNPDFFQRDDRLYTYPTSVGEIQKQFGHVNFEQQPEVLVNDDLLLANLEVTFLTKSNVNTLRDERDVLGHDMYLTGAFNYLKGGDFKFHKLSDFETWDCFKTSKGDIEKFNRSQTGANKEHLLAGWVMFTCKTEIHSKRGFIPPCNGDNVIKMNHHKINNHERGSPDTANHLIPPSDNSKEYGNGAKTGGAKPNGDNVTKANHHKVNNHERGTPDTVDHLRPPGDKSKESGNGAKTGGAKPS
eukprot:jgi/Psemu1/21916/gm1.21916_g